MDANRTVQLTDAGLERLTATRRRLAVTVEAIAADPGTPSANTVKRALRQGPVFVSTLERIWAFLAARAAERRQTLSELVEGIDYAFVVVPAATSDSTTAAPIQRGWLSRRVPRPNRLFTGRREILARLHAALAGSADPQALSGLGGIGKTQTAIAYVYEHRNAYQRVFWVNADTVESLEDGLADLVDALDLERNGTRRDALARVHDWFRDASDWLLVLDNADDLAELAPRFPPHHNGRLLLTTRARNPVKWAEPIRLPKFRREEGALLLLRRAGTLGATQTLSEAPPADVEAAMELSDELDGLPLAINQAGAFLAESMRSIRDYLAQYRAEGVRLLDRTGDRDHAPVAITVQLAVARMAERSTVGGAAVDLVRLCAFLAPDAIPDAVLRASRPAAAVPAPDFDAVCAAVCHESLAARDPESGTLTIHRLVQRAVRESLSSAERAAEAVRAVAAVAAATPDFEFEDWPLCDRLLPHWRRCAGYIAEADLESGDAAFLLYQAGRYLRARALYAEAEALLRDAGRIAEAVYGPTDGTTADALDELACLYREIDRPDAAEPLHRRSLAITEAADGPVSVKTASKRHNLALFYLEKGALPEAETHFLAALAIWERYPGEHEIFKAATLTQLGGVYRQQGAFDRAEPHYRNALAIYERILPESHIEIATACNNLGLLCVNIARFDEAEALLRRSIAINAVARGKTHPETGTAIWSLAWSTWKRGRLADADALYRQAIAIYTRHFSKDHSRLARLLAQHAQLCDEMG